MDQDLRQEDMNSEELQQPDHEEEQLCIPPFYGTGEILTWQAESLLSLIGTKGFIRELASFSLEEQFDAAAVYAQVKEQIIANSCMDCRGYYGFFPVISEKKQIVILNPDDFRSELGVLDFQGVSDRQFCALCDRVRSGGDTLGMLVGACGQGLTDMVQRLFPDKKEFITSRCVEQIGSAAAGLIAKRLTEEIRRCLMAKNSVGTSVSLDDGRVAASERSSMAHLQATCLALLCAEDRLGVSVSESAGLVPRFSTLGLFTANSQPPNEL
ncbi:MAG: hypothetical protein JW795_20235 [Chitinivibrionales bacterium]|nr:hypothetical protein [Chitinivibrionales bacterium]